MNPSKDFEQMYKTLERLQDKIDQYSRNKRCPERDIDKICIILEDILERLEKIENKITEEHYEGPRRQGIEAILNFQEGAIIGINPAGSGGGSYEEGHTKHECKKD